MMEYTAEQLDLLQRLLEAAQAGECPDRTCNICQKKWATIEGAKQVIAKATGGD